MEREKTPPSDSSLLLRLWEFVKIATGILVIASLGMVTGNGVLKQKHLLEEGKSRLEKENERLFVEIRMMERDLTLLGENPQAIEKAAKGKLGMARQDETIYIFESGLASSPNRRSNPSTSAVMSKKR